MERRLALVVLIALGSVASAQPIPSGGLRFVTHSAEMTGLGTSLSPLGLITTCSTGQVLAWSGSVWACSSAAAVVGSGTSGDLTAWSGTGTVGNYAGSSPSACSAGSVITGAALSAAGVVSYTCTATGLTGLTNNSVVKAGSGTTIANGWATDDGTTWGTTSKFTITEASGNFKTFGTGEIAGAATFDSYANHATISTPSAPASGVDLFATSIAGRSMAATLNVGNAVTPLGPWIATKNFMLWSGGTGSALINQAGNSPSLSTTGTITSRTPDNVAFGSTLGRVGYVSAAGAGSLISIRGAGGLPKVYLGTIAAAGGFTFVTDFMVSDASLVTTANMFAGLIGSVITTDTTPSTSANIIGVGCDNGDTHLQLYSSGGSTQARVDLGASFPVNTTNVDVYRLILFAPSNGSNIQYTVTRLNTGDTTSGTITGANLPAATTRMGPQLFRSNGGTASAVGLDFTRVYLEEDY